MISVKRIPLAVLWVWSAFQADPAKAGTILVPSERPTIQQGIESAVHGDTVLVSPGIYTENIHFNGRNIVVVSRFAVTGEFEDIRSTVIDGSSPSDPESGSCVRFISGEDSTAVLEGFTLTGGTGTVHADGGTWRCDGGGVFIKNASPIIKNNWILFNKAANKDRTTGAAGGGIASHQGNPAVIGNAVMWNQGLSGAGLSLIGGNVKIRNNVIAFNNGGQDSGGGGLWIFKGSAWIINNTITSNLSSGNGVSYSGYAGGILSRESNVTGNNNIIWGNKQITTQQVYKMKGALALTYNIIESRYSGTGNILLDPKFSEFNFILSADSPCRDAGDPGVLYNDPENPSSSGQALAPALGGVRGDMGAYGGPECLKWTGHFCFSNDSLILTSPPEGEVYAVDTEVLLKAEASNPGHIAWMDYYVNDENVGRDSEPPYECLWKTVEPGAYRIGARAADVHGPFMGTVTAQTVPVVVPHLAFKKPADASSVEMVPLYNPDCAFDGNALTRWSSLFADPQWLCVDLRETCMVDSVVLVWETAAGLVYQIRVSTDSLNWTTVFETESGESGTKVIAFPPVQARYVRMEGARRTTMYGYSLYEFEVYGTSTTEVSSNGRDCIPETFGLCQNHPNPFNPSTTIEFLLPRSGRVVLGVYDVNGKEVNKLIDGNFSAGRHVIAWNARGVPSGVYVARLQAEGGKWSDSIKMLLVR